MKNLFKNMQTTFLLLYSILLKFLLSINSVRFDNVYTDTDHSIFYVIGKELIKGKVLYKEIFDHKTPYIYFFNAFAALLDYRHLGLFIIEVILLYISLYFIYKIVKLFVIDDKRVVLIVCIIGMLFTIPEITFGYSRTEEYAIACLLPSIYIFYRAFIKYVDHDESWYKYLQKRMFLIGVLAGITFMTNIRAVVLFVPFAVATLFICIKNKQYKNIFVLFANGLLGVVVSIVPYIIYAIVTDSVSDAIDAIYYANMAYASSSKFDFNYNEFVAMKDSIVSFTIIIIGIVTSLLTLFFYKKNNYIKASTIICILLALIYIFTMKRVYIYYFVILFPALLPFLIFIINKLKFLSYMKYGYFSALTLILLALYMVPNINITNIRYKNQSNRARKIKEAIVDECGDIKKLSILGFGIDPEIYQFLECDVDYKYFFIPNLDYKKFRAPYDAQYNYIINTYPDVIIIKDNVAATQYPSDMQNQLYHALNYKYNKIATITTNLIEGEYYIYHKINQN